jgi:hypothetical protein
MRIISIAVILVMFASVAFAQTTVPKGIYLEMYYGTKSGGPSNHQQLFQELSKDQKLLGFAFFCIKGLSRAADSSNPGYAIERERRLPPVVVKQCKGSAAILMGPVLREEIQDLLDHLANNYLHLYTNMRRVD